MEPAVTDRKQHWEGVYGRNEPTAVSWFQPEAKLSLELIRSWVPDRDEAILDVGGGASTLVDDLLADGYRRVTVVELAAAALAVTRSRLGERAAGAVSLIEADVLTVELPAGSVGCWHDRAVFHFLTDPADQDRYLAQVRRIVRPGGVVLIATFAADGPTRCSGLPVARYSPAELQAVFGPGFELLDTRREMHTTPTGATQAFTYALFRWSGRGGAVHRMVVIWVGEVGGGPVHGRDNGK